jgi:hypothetical protein
VTIESTAVFSADRRYRYSLTRDTSPYMAPRAAVLFVMLNPSTADEIANDPTVTRCLARACKWNFRRLIVCNIFALRSTDPRALDDVDDPIGPQNDAAILSAASAAELVVCAWGSDRAVGTRGRRVLELIRSAGARPHALRVNKNGEPAHPLYLPYALEAAPL